MKKFAIVFFALFITACYPNTDKNKLALLGLDLNENGLRDDVDSFISKQKYNPAQKLAVENMARVTQQALSVDLKNETELKTLHKDVNFAITCLIQTPMPEKIIDSKEAHIAVAIEKLTINTKERQDIYNAYDATWDKTLYIPTNYPNACEHKFKQLYN